MFSFHETKNITYKNIHGWKYAYRNLETSELEPSWSNKFQFGVCGDWLFGSKAEHAWMSANNLYFRIKRLLSPHSMGSLFKVILAYDFNKDDFVGFE